MSSTSKSSEQVLGQSKRSWLSAFSEYSITALTWLRRCFSLILTRRMRQTRDTTTKKARKIPISKYSVGCLKMKTKILFFLSLDHTRIFGSFIFSFSTFSVVIVKCTQSQRQKSKYTLFCSLTRILWDKIWVSYVTASEWNTQNASHEMSDLVSLN